MFLLSEEVEEVEEGEEEECIQDLLAAQA